MKQLLSVFILWSLAGYFSSLHGQMYEPYYEYDPDYEVIVRYDTIVCYDTLYVSTLEEVTRLFNLSFDEFAKQLLDKIAETEQDSLTAEQLYLNYLLPMRFPSQVNQRYIVRNYRVEAKEEQVHLHPQDLTFPTGVFQDSLQLDLLVTFRGDTETDRFLASSSLQASCLEQLFVAVDNFPNHAIKGVNFYFPDYSFRKKRSMAQFMKSASLVIDSCRLESIRDIRLYATFDREKGDRHRSYLYTLTQMTDSVMLVNSRSDEWPQHMEILRKEDALRTNFFIKMWNQFYLARYYTADFPETNDKELTKYDLHKLMYADYPYNGWETYLFFLLLLFFIWAAIGLGYGVSPVFSSFIHRKSVYFFSFLILSSIEAYLLFFCMVENFSLEQVFSLKGENQAALLIIPLLFIFIIPILFLLNRKQQKP